MKRREAVNNCSIPVGGNIWTLAGGELHSTGLFTAALHLAGQGTYLFRSGTSGTSGFNGKNGKRSGMGGGQMMAMPPEWDLTYTVLIFGMWVVMMVAMLLPSVIPMMVLVTALAGIASPIPTSFLPWRCCLRRAIFSSGAGAASPLPWCNGISTKLYYYPRGWRSAMRSWPARY